MTEEVPQVEREEELYAEVPQWPKVIGILSIIWASLTTCCIGIGLLQMMRKDPNMPADLADKVSAMQTGPLAIAGHSLGLIGLILLFSAGICTLMRKIAGRWLHIVYAVVGFVQLGLGLYSMRLGMRVMSEWAAQNPGEEFAKALSSPIFGAVMKVSMAVMGLVYGAYPLFCLIWFGAVKRTQESMTGVPASFSGDQRLPG